MSSAASGSGRELRVEFTDPDARVIDDPTGLWYVLCREAAADRDVSRMIAGGDGAEFCKRYRGALVVCVRRIEGRVHRLDAWRGLFSYAELFYSLKGIDGIIVSDHFRNVLARLPRAERYPSEDGLTEHYLFRRPYGHTTISAGVDRLGQAEKMSIDLASGETASTMFDRLDVEPTRRSENDYLDLIEAELKDSLASVSVHDTNTMFFSGGVDSTLLLSYAKELVTPFTFVTDTPEFRIETAYAREAAGMVGTALTEVSMPEADFLEMLEAATESLGVPCFDDATPYLTRLAAEQPNNRMVVGLGADSAFGMSLKLARFSSWFRGPVVLPAVTALAKRMPGHLGFRMRQVAPKAAQFAKPLFDPGGFAGSARTSGDTDLLQKVLGRERIEAAAQRELDYAAERVSLTADPAEDFLSQIELAHWLVVFVNPLASEHAAAHSLGKRVVSPYCDPGVLSALATIPVQDRYIRRLSAKWILKDLLVRRVPDYPVNRRKKSTALPWQRFYRSGPLTDIWNVYPVPDLFPGDLGRELIDEPIANTWTAISYSVWEERVVRNPDLQPHAATLATALEIAAE